MFPLRETPLPDTLGVRVDGAPVAGWTLVDGAVVFHRPPPAGSEIVATYEVPAR
jgi:hypothetical protein